MELWFDDYHQEDVKLGINVQKVVHTEQTEYQHVAVLDSREYGRILTLDGELITTEKDEYFYSEMMAHVPLSANPKIKNVLVIGGCDGGVLCELEKYQSIENIDVVELDQRLVEICQEHLPETRPCFDDPRVSLYIQDALKFVRHCENAYDLIIVDSANPFGLNESLFTREFYGNCYNALTEHGILLTQQVNGFYNQDVEAFKHVMSRLKAVFPINETYMISVPSYAAGYILAGFSSKGTSWQVDEANVRLHREQIETIYYNLPLHQAAFALPNYLKELS